MHPSAATNDEQKLPPFQRELLVEPDLFELIEYLAELSGRAGDALCIHTIVKLESTTGHRFVLADDQAT